MDIRNSCHLRRNGVHEQAGNKRRFSPLAPRHIETGALHRQDQLPQSHAGRGHGHPGILLLVFVEFPDVSGRFGNNGHISGRNIVTGLLDMRGGNPQSVRA